MEVVSVDERMSEGESARKKRSRPKSATRSPQGFRSPVPSGDGGGGGGGGEEAGMAVPPKAGNSLGGGVGGVVAGGGPSAGGEDVAVVQLGSYQTRYGHPRDRSPTVARTLVAFRKKSHRPSPKDASAPASPSESSKAAAAAEGEGVSVETSAQRKNDELFSSTLDSIVTDTRMEVRHRGGGKPVPWTVVVEELEAGKAAAAAAAATGAEGAPDANGIDASEERADPAQVLVGDSAVAVLDDEGYDVVRPLRSGRLDRTSAAIGSVRGALCRLLKAAVGGAGSVVLIVPEEATRKDVVEMVDCCFQAGQVRRLFVHHSSAAAAFGAGLSSCVVVDIGHEGGYVVCVEDGSTITDSRIRLEFGGAHLSAALRRVIDERGEQNICRLSPAERGDVLDMVKVQLCDAASEENDSIAVGTVTARSGRKFRVKMGIGPRVSPVMGFFYTDLLRSALPPVPGAENGETDDDESRWLESLVDEGARSAKAASARPLGFFSDFGTGFPPLEEAIATSVLRATDDNGLDKRSELKRFLGAVLLVGGAVRVPNLSRVIERRIKKLIEKGWIGADPKMVDVVVGGKEMDAAALAWKGGAVLSQTESINDMFVTDDEWSTRSVRALREKAPFFW